MNALDDYQAKALSFRLESANSTYALFGLVGEVGEIFSLLAKGIRDGTPLDIEQKMKKELGDVLWMVAAVAADNGWKLSDIADSNIVKLTDRKKRDVLQGSGDER